jgi:ribosomal protein S5
VPTEGTQQGSARPPITGNTQGVVGISNLKLEAAPSAAQGSVLSSEKNNVKVESGTMLLLKVNP